MCKVKGKYQRVGQIYRRFKNIDVFFSLLIRVHIVATTPLSGLSFVKLRYFRIIRRFCKYTHTRSRTLSG